MERTTHRKAGLGAMLAALLSSATLCASATPVTFTFNTAESPSASKTFSQSGVTLDVTALGAADGPLGTVLVTLNSSGLGVNNSFDSAPDAGAFDSQPGSGITSVEERLVFTFTTSAPAIKLLQVGLLNTTSVPWGLADNLNLYADGSLVLGPDYDPVVTASGIWDVAGEQNVTFTNSFSIALTSANLQELTRIKSITIETIPIPAAVWLFGSGLIGLAGIARKAKTAT